LSHDRWRPSSSRDFINTQIQVKRAYWRWRDDGYGDTTAPHHTAPHRTTPHHTAPHRTAAEARRDRKERRHESQLPFFFSPPCRLYLVITSICVVCCSAFNVRFSCPL
jgi:hypothetical protein